MENENINYRSFKKNALKFNINAGEVYGVYEVIEPVKIDTQKCQKVYWIYENVYTKKQFKGRGSYIFSLKERTDIKSQENQYGLRNRLYNTTIKNAKGRNHEFKLTFDEFNELISKNCYYCNEEPSRATDKMIISYGDTHQYPLYYNGIDRIDSSKGYILDNCVPCCSQCNYMKHTSSQESFLKQIEKVYNHLIKK